MGEFPDVDIFCSGVNRLVESVVHYLESDVNVIENKNRGCYPCVERAVTDVPVADTNLEARLKVPDTNGTAGYELRVYVMRRPRVLLGAGASVSS